jgi:hypothetical protein
LDFDVRCAVWGALRQMSASKRCGCQHTTCRRAGATVAINDCQLEINRRMSRRHQAITSKWVTFVKDFHMTTQQPLLASDSFIFRTNARQPRYLGALRRRVLSMAVATLLICYCDSIYAQQQAINRARFSELEFFVKPTEEFTYFNRYGVFGSAYWQSTLAQLLNNVPKSDSKQGGSPKEDLAHEWPPGTPKVPGNGNSASIEKHLLHAMDENDVFGRMSNYQAESKTGSMQAYGAVTMFFKRINAKPKEAEDDKAQFDISIGILNPEISGRAGIDFLVQVDRIPTWGYITTGYHNPEPLTVLGENNKPAFLSKDKDDKVFITPLSVNPKPMASYQKALHSDLKFDRGITEGSKGVLKGDLVRVTVMARVWADADGNKPPFPTVPEPATWLLGLTGLAAVIGSQTWRKRNLKAPV